MNFPDVVCFGYIIVTEILKLHGPLKHKEGNMNIYKTGRHIAQREK